MLYIMVIILCFVFFPHYPHYLKDLWCYCELLKFSWSHSTRKSLYFLVIKLNLSL